MSKLKWLAQQTPAIIELSKDLYRQIRPFCTEKTCRKMTAGKYEYQWKHHPRSKKPRSYAAQYYFKLMFQWINQQKYIYEMENMRHDRLVRQLSEEGNDDPVLHPLFRKDTLRILIVDYLHDPFYYLTGIWAKAFSVFAHVFCEHFGNEELSPEVKSYIEASFERFMRFVKGYRILSARRLAPLDKRISKIDFKALPTTTIQTGAPRESKSVILQERSKTAKATLSRNGLPSTVSGSLLKMDDSRSGLSPILKSDSIDRYGEKEKSERGTSPVPDNKEDQNNVKKEVKKEEGEKDGYISDPEVASGGDLEEPGGDDFDPRNRAATKSSGGSARYRADSGGGDIPDKENPGSKEKSS